MSRTQTKFLKGIALAKALRVPYQLPIRYNSFTGLPFSADMKAARAPLAPKEILRRKAKRKAERAARKRNRK